jgi:hypothetical protein
MPKYHHFTITRQQRIALKKVFDRKPLWYAADGRIVDNFEDSSVLCPSPLTYREFRGEVLRGDFGCIMIQWANMWLGIEHDGYTHS